MPDIRTLLHDAAPKPLAPLDMLAVRHRAARRSSRRVFVWLAGLAAVLGAGIPAGNALLVSAGPGEHAATIRPAPSPDPDPSADPDQSADPGRPTTGAAIDDRAGADSQSPLVADGGDDVDGSDSTPGTRGSDPVLTDPSGAPSSTVPAARSQQSTTSTTPSFEFPHAASCSVDNEGLAEGEQRTCRFTATAAGGWNYYQPPEHLPSVSNIPSVEITVTRGNRTFTYRTRKVYDQPGGGYRLEGCADDIIEPGDLVTVMIVEPEYVWMDMHTEMGAGAGEHWGCTDPGP